MNIPKEIQIAGKTVTIKIDHDYCFTHKVYGSCLYDKNMIILDEVTGSFPRQKQEQTFIRELIHFINAVLSKHEEAQDKEDYVNPLSELLYQVVNQFGFVHDINKLEESAMGDPYFNQSINRLISMDCPKDEIMNLLETNLDIAINNNPNTKAYREKLRKGLGEQ